jgi:hypothetical protein
MSDAVAALAILGVLAAGWAAAVQLMRSAVGFGWLAEARSRRSVYAFVVVNAGLALLPGTPAAAAWIAADRSWVVLAWILGAVSAVLAGAVVVWIVGHLNT